MCVQHVCGGCVEKLRAPRGVRHARARDPAARARSAHAPATLPRLTIVVLVRGDQAQRPLEAHDEAARPARDAKGRVEEQLQRRDLPDDRAGQEAVAPVQAAHGARASGRARASVQRSVWGDRSLRALTQPLPLPLRRAHCRSTRRCRTATATATATTMRARRARARGGAAWGARSGAGSSRPPTTTAMSSWETTSRRPPASAWPAAPAGSRPPSLRRRRRRRSDLARCHVVAPPLGGQRPRASPTCSSGARRHCHRRRRSRL